MSILNFGMKLRISCLACKSIDHPRCQFASLGNSGCVAWWAEEAPSRVLEGGQQPKSQLRCRSCSDKPEQTRRESICQEVVLTINLLHD